ncbi:acid-sensing (proton-gated) ion channel [Nesidiocoris tenuis]|uniref:Acid-sensing (Proton-gated) ion channel n=1 Tax=Nesidiocoris tenuis TaxID=355587 RepID=A0ABN7BD55_9HEMI|nr:acid-sensing (proton-gated) ion channel [Nesidiocoris tenuis]
MYPRELDNPIRVRPMYPPEYIQPQYVPKNNGYKNTSRTGNNKTGSPGKKERLFREYCEETTLHGLKYLVKPNRPKYERAYWLIALLVTYTLLFKTLWDQLQGYRSPVLISFEPEPTTISTLPLPAVTLCPDMQVRNSYLNLSSTLAEGHNISGKQEQLFYLATTFCGINFHEREVPNSFLPDTIVNFSLAHNTYAQCEDFIAVASLAFKRIVDPCYYFRPTFTEQGACITFNLLPDNQIYKISEEYSNKYPSATHQSQLGREAIWSPDDGYRPISKKQIRPRKDGNPPLAASDNAVAAGYIIMLQVPSLKFDEICHGGRGFHGYIHNPAEPPTSGHTYFYVAPAEELDIRVEPKVYTISRDLLTWGPSTRMCYMQYERSLAYFRFYTQRNCEQECESNFTAKVCNCVPFFRPSESAVF